MCLGAQAALAVQTETRRVGGPVASVGSPCSWAKGNVSRSSPARPSSHDVPFVGETFTLARIWTLQRANKGRAVVAQTGGGEADVGSSGFGGRAERTIALSKSSQDRCASLMAACSGSRRAGPKAAGACRGWCPVPAAKFAGGDARAIPTGAAGGIALGHLSNGARSQARGPPAQARGTGNQSSTNEERKHPRFFVAHAAAAGGFPSPPAPPCCSACLPSCTALPACRRRPPTVASRASTFPARPRLSSSLCESPAQQASVDED